MSTSPTNDERVRAFLEIGQLHKDWIAKFIQGSAFCCPETLHATAVLMFKILETNLPGNFVECGVGAGAQPGVMHYCMRFSGKYRPIYLFDTFCGIPRITAEDIPTDDHPGDDFRKCVGDRLAAPGERGVTSGKVSFSVEAVQANMKRWGADAQHLRYIKGWAEDTVPKTDTGPISILRLDMDLYSPTKVCLEHLYPRLVVGGYIVIDDWNLAGARRAVIEYFGREPRIIEIPGGNGPVFWKKARA